MPGILGIIEAVATNPVVDDSVEQLLTGLFNHLKEQLATGNAAAVGSALDSGLAAIPQMVTAVTANTPAGSEAT